MDSRYQHPGVAGIWNRQRQIHLWVRVELAWMEQISEIAAAQASSVSAPKAVEVASREIETNHEFVAFLDVWTDRFTDMPEAQRWVHYGLTSSDVIDAATAIQLRDSHHLLAALASELVVALREASERVGTMLQVGRTHGQHAQPRLLAVPLDTLSWMLQRTARRLALAYPDILEVDLSGPTGGRDGLDPNAVGWALDTLGLTRSICSTQIVPRDSWVHWAQGVANLATVCEAIADQYWLWAQTEIGEVEVLRGAGSSAMPHKLGNPHVAENVRGLARMARSMSFALSESIVQRGDRDLAHSSVERVMIPDLVHLVATAMVRTAEIVENYQFAPERIEANLVSALGESVDSALQTMKYVRGGETRTDAIARTREENQ